MQLQKTLISFLSIVIFISCNDANVKPNTSLGFIKSFGGTAQSNTNYSAKVEIAGDGGYVLLGTSSAFNDPGQIYLIKTDKNGNKLWERNYGGPGTDFGASIKQTLDGGYIIIGSYEITASGAFLSSMYVIKTNEKGDTLWTRQYNETAKKAVYGTDISISADGNFYLLAGYIKVSESRYDGFIRKINSSGNVSVAIPSNLSINRYPISIYEGEEESIDWFGTGGLIEPGADASIKTPIIVGLNNRGNAKYAYDKTAPDINENNMEGISEAYKLPNGGYVCTGSSINNGVTKAYILSLSNIGSPKYLVKSFYKEMPSGQFSTGNSVIQTSDGGFAILGSISNASNLKNWGRLDVYLAKLDKDGNLEWEKTYGGSENDTGISLKQTNDGGYVIAATTEQVGNTETIPVLSLIKVDASGNIKN